MMMSRFGKPRHVNTILQKQMFLFRVIDEDRIRNSLKETIKMRRVCVVVHLLVCTPRALQRWLRGGATVKALPVEEESHFL